MNKNDNSTRSTTPSDPLSDGMSKRRPSPRERGAVKLPPSTRTALSAEQIARRSDRQRPEIARTREARKPAPATASDAGPTDAALASIAPTSVAQRAQSLPTSVRPFDPGNTNAGSPSVRVGRDPDANLVGARQMAVWEVLEDVDAITEWIEASTRAPRTSLEDQQIETDPPAVVPEVMWRVTTPVAESADLDARRADLRDLFVRSDLAHLTPVVRAAVIELVVEHRFVSHDTDRWLAALGIRFGIWSMTKSTDGAFDPFRDLTEDRIAAFVRGTGAHLKDGSRDTYAAALRRLAAGPTVRHAGKRRKAVPPLGRRVEDGLWAAADAFHPDSWQHQEAKTLLALSFGVGAMPAEINLAGPEDILTRTCGSDLLVTVRLIRSKTWVRDVPVLDDRYAQWLAARAAQVAGHTYLFKPDRRDRSNAINATTRRLAQLNSAFERFELNAARNSWAVAALQDGVPFAAWAQAAGIGPGTHLPADLLPYLPTPTPAEVDAAFRRSTGTDSPITAEPADTTSTTERAPRHNPESPDTESPSTRP